MAKARNNRTAGNNYERFIVNELKARFPLFNKACTSRLESKSLDDQKVDICFTPGFNFQCKNSKANLDYNEIINSMPVNENKNVIIHRKTKKVNTRFVTQGDYVILKKEDFYKLLEK